MRVIVSQALFGLAAVLALAASSCTGERSSTIVQLCLGDEQGLASFKQLLQAIARSEQLTFIDGSDATRRDLEAIGSDLGRPPVIHMAMEREDGTGLTAANLGLPGYQVAVGFAPATTRPFADRVIRELKVHWPVTVVPHPQTRGALPLQGCTDTSAG